MNGSIGLFKISNGSLSSVDNSRRDLKARWAVICSLNETAKLNKVEPHAYITDILTRMTNGYPESKLDDLLPWNWKQDIINV